MQKQYEDKIKQQASLPFNPLLNLANVEMTDENADPSLSGTTTPDMSFATAKTMGTRRKPTDVGRVPNVIRTKQSNESSLEPTFFRN